VANIQPVSCTRRLPAVPGAAALTAPATGRPQQSLSAQGRAAGQGKPKPTAYQAPCKCVSSIPSSPSLQPSRNMSSSESPPQAQRRDLLKLLGHRGIANVPPPKPGSSLPVPRVPCSVTPRKSPVTPSFLQPGLGSQCPQSDRLEGSACSLQWQLSPQTLSIFEAKARV
jgi:hypothetical protein